MCTYLNYYVSFGNVLINFPSFNLALRLSMRNERSSRSGKCLEPPTKLLVSSTWYYYSEGTIHLYSAICNILSHFVTVRHVVIMCNAYMPLTPI